MIDFRDASTYLTHLLAPTCALSSFLSLKQSNNNLNLLINFTTYYPSFLLFNLQIIFLIACFNRNPANISVAWLVWKRTLSCHPPCYYNRQWYLGNIIPWFNNFFTFIFFTTKLKTYYSMRARSSQLYLSFDLFYLLSLYYLIFLLIFISQ